MLDVPMLPTTPKTDRVGSPASSKDRMVDDRASAEGSDFETAYADDATGAKDQVNPEPAEDKPLPEEAGEVSPSDAEEDVTGPVEVSSSDELPDFGLVADGAKNGRETTEPAVSTEQKTRKLGLGASEVLFQQRLLQTSFTEGDDQRLTEKPGLIGASPGYSGAVQAVPSLITSVPGAPAAQDGTNAAIPGLEGVGTEGFPVKLEKAPAPAVSGSTSAPSALPLQTVFGAPPAASRSKAETLAEQFSSRLTAAEVRAPAGETPQVQTAPVAPLKTAAALPGGLTALIAKEQSAAGLKPLSGETMDAPAAWDARSQAPASLAQVIARAETPAMIGRQIAETFHRMADSPMELALNPKELGRVKMSISASELGITVSVLAERPETLDLMRRNIDQLAREFQAIGYENINFAFAEGRSEQNSENSPESGSGGSGFSEERMDLAAMPTVLNLSPSTGLDLRL